MKGKVVECIYAAVDEANFHGGADVQLEKSLETPIHGSASGLDSLGLINLVVAVEENVEREFGVMIVLSDDRALDQDPSPFESIGALAAYAEMLIEEQQ